MFGGWWERKLALAFGEMPEVRLSPRELFYPLYLPSSLFSSLEKTMPGCLLFCTPEACRGVRVRGGGKSTLLHNNHHLTPPPSPFLTFAPRVTAAPATAAASLHPGAEKHSTSLCTVQVLPTNTLPSSLLTPENYQTSSLADAPSPPPQYLPSCSDLLISNGVPESTDINIYVWLTTLNHK